MKYFDIKTKKEWTDKRTGESKKIYLKVGSLTQFPDGRYKIDLAMYPDTNFYVFEPYEDKKQDPPF